MIRFLDSGGVPKRVDRPQPSGDPVPTGAVLVHHPSLMNAGEGCRAVASRATQRRARPPWNELRLGKPLLHSGLLFGCDSPRPARQADPASNHRPLRSQKTANGLSGIHRSCAFRVPARSAPRLPSLSDARKQATRPRSEEWQSQSPLLHRPHARRPRRLVDYNAGRCPYTARYRPWQLHVAIELPHEQRAIDLERGSRGDLHEPNPLESIGQHHSCFAGFQARLSHPQIADRCLDERRAEQERPHADADCAGSRHRRPFRRRTAP